MSDTDFIREVEEEVRRERMKKLWDRFGPYVLFTAVAVVAIVAGVKFYEHYAKTQAETGGARFVNAELLAEDGKTEEALTLFKKLQAEGAGGYPLLSKLRIAGEAATKGDKAEAIKAYDEAAKDSSDALFAGFAKISAAALRLDDADFAEMEKRLGDMVGGDNAWRHSARELLGLSAYRAKKFDEAKVFFDELLSDAKAPSQIRQRSEMMLSLILGASGSDSAAAASDKSDAKSDDSDKKSANDKAK